MLRVVLLDLAMLGVFLVLTFACYLYVFGLRELP
jgi:hypothetical protein